MDHGAVWKRVRAQLIAGLIYVSSEVTKEDLGTQWSVRFYPMEEGGS
jgi:hypothetical protein